LTTPTTTVDVNVRIAQYVQLRDKIKVLDDAHKKKMEPFREMLDQLGGLLLVHLQTVGGDSIATPSGTVYKTVKNSASIADGQSFWDFIVANNEFDLLDKKANVSAVQDFIEQHHAPPPGVKFTSVVTVGVRRK
jgi:hypothetical protein